MDKKHSITYIRMIFLIYKKMIMKSLLSILIFATLFCTSENVFGQNINIGSPIDSTKFFKIELKDGSVFFGKILQKDSMIIVKRTSPISKLEIPFLNIKMIDEIDESNFKNGEYWFPYQHATRYLYSPSAINLGKWEVYYQNIYLLFNSINVGITDNISVGVGIVPLSTPDTLNKSSFNPILIITPKVGFKVANNFYVGGGVLYINTPDFDFGNRIGLGIAYGIGTYGNLDHNITGGLGWGFNQGEFSDLPVITFSAMTRISKKTALVTENWLIPIDYYIKMFSYGIRFFGENMAFDLAFINNPDIAKAIVIGIPFVSFAIKF